VIGPLDFRTKTEGHPSPPAYQRNPIASQPRLQLDNNSQSRSKSNRPTRIQHTICKADNKICDGASINQKEKEKAQLEGYPAQSIQNTLTTQNLKQELATTDLGPNNRGGFQKNNPQQTPQEHPHPNLRNINRPLNSSRPQSILTPTLSPRLSTTTPSKPHHSNPHLPLGKATPPQSPTTTTEHI